MRQKIWSVVMNYSLLLVFGACLALLWANIDPLSYKVFHDIVILEDFFIGYEHVDAAGQSYRVLTLHYFVNDILMAIFFAIAGKEVWEAIALRDGSLKGVKAVTPLVATLGGVIGPITVYLAVALLFGSTTFNVVANGWAIPTATDIAFSYLVGRIVFGAGHPAVSFLLLLAIVDDAIGLIILAIFYPTGALEPLWLLLSFGVALFVYVTCNWLPRYLDRGDAAKKVTTWCYTTLGYWPYVIAGAISWYGFQESGMHPALGLLPIIPAIPHADHDFGFFAEDGHDTTDLLNLLEEKLKYAVQGILFVFGLMNAGVEFSAVGVPTLLVLLGLLIGKPVGIFCFGFLAARVLGFGMPAGMKLRDLFVLGCVAGIGFTVALFVASVAFPAGPVQDAAKMGALLSLCAAVVAIIAGKVLRVQKIHG
jgi:NhaA family Na+:H+ antiporter